MKKSAQKGLPRTRTWLAGSCLGVDGQSFSSVAGDFRGESGCGDEAASWEFQPKVEPEEAEAGLGGVVRSAGIQRGRNDR